jgi:hypothetical protein
VKIDVSAGLFAVKIERKVQDLMHLAECCLIIFLEELFRLRLSRKS